MDEKLEELSFKDGEKSIILDIIPVLDNTIRSFQYHNDFKPIYNNLLSALTKHGLKHIDIKIGDRFDLDTMNAVYTCQANNDNEKGCVCDIVSHGYTLNNEVIKFADVAVYV